MAGRAIPASSAGHPGRGAPTRHALTFNPDHLMGASHGVKGNSHMLMMDRNSDDIARRVHDWLGQQGLTN